MTRLTSLTAAPLTGRVGVPGDKSISHRALILGAINVGQTTIRGLLEADDVLATAAAMRHLGADVRADNGAWRVWGRGVGGLSEPATVLDMGNSGTGARLVIGLAASHPFTSFFCGDTSLSSRPMRRIIAPLSEMGARFVSRSGDRLPLCVQGEECPIPIEYRLPVASAQVKSAILLAGLNASGTTTVIEPRPSRDHTERLLRHFGARLVVRDLDDGARLISVDGPAELAGDRAIVVPGDLSSAAFPLVAALIVPGSRLTLTDVGVNPLRAGLIDTLLEMGAGLRLVNERMAGGEPVADIEAAASPLRGVEVPAERAPSMIDEFPVLAVAAACARGVTRMRGLAELRVKESDRLAAIVDGLTACGVKVEAGEDWLAVEGTGEPPAGGADVRVRFDHRIAMAFLVLGTASRRPVTIDDAGAIRTSFPTFVKLMDGLGARIAPVEGH